MATLLITYDLNHEVRRPPIVKAIKGVSGSWARLSESSYAVQTTMSPGAVHQRLRPMLDEDDTIFIIPLSKPYAGRGAREVIDWLDENLSLAVAC